MSSSLTLMSAYRKHRRESQQNFSPRPNTGSEFDPDEVVPETPPRSHVNISRKPVLASQHGEIESELSGVSIEGSKPTKKRKIFNTPPRQDGTAVNYAGLNPEGTSERLSPASVVGDTQLRSSQGSVLDAEVDLTISSAQKLFSMHRVSLKGFESREQRQMNIRSGSFMRVGSRNVAAPGDYTQRCGPRPVSLDMVTTSSATLSRLFESFTKKQTAEIEEMKKAQVLEIRKLGQSITETMSSELRNIQGLFEMLTGGGKNRSRSLASSTPSLKDWEKTLDGLTPYTTVIFGNDLFSRVLSFNAPLKAVDTYSKYHDCGVSDVERCSLSAQTLLFRLQPADKKLQYLDDVGKLHSDFKFSVIRNAFYNVHLDSFGLFTSKGSARTDSGDAFSEANIGDARAKIQRPSWLEKGCLSINHIVEARAFIELSGQSRKEKIRRTFTPDDIAFHGAPRVYRQIGKVLHDGRGNLRVSFFPALGYLLVPWNDRVAGIDQTSMSLEFQESIDMGYEATTLALEEIPFAAQCAQNAGASAIAEADASNKQLLRDIFSQWHDMVLVVEHDVMVSLPEQHRTAQSTGQRKVLHLLVNLIDVALESRVEFCRDGSRELFLRSSKNSIHSVMIFSVLLKAICIEFMKKWDNTNSAVRVFPEPTNVRVYGTCLKDLMPGLSTQKSILGSKCLQMPHSLYDALNHATGDEEFNSNDLESMGNGSILDLRRIEESVEDVICPI